MRQMKYAFRCLLLCLAAWLLYSCASIGNPSGGRRDERPPQVVRSNPAPYATGVKSERVVIEFDEIVNVKDAFSKVVISPTSAETPRVSSLGRKVTVQFKDTLQPNTTYTIDFADAIEDNNEANKLSSYAFTFSTGDEIDSLRISGMVLGAQDLEPQQGILVGVHTNMEDTAFSRTRLARVAKTDDRGRFTIRGLKEGPYRLFALKDLNNDYRWDNPEEDIAFHSELIYPTSEPDVAVDSVFNDITGELDSVVNRDYTSFLPNDILLSSFNIQYKPQYLMNYERVDSTRIQLIFNAPSDTLPEVDLVDMNLEKDKEWYRLQRSAKNDTLVYWLRDPKIISTDTLRLATRYLRTDSAKMLSPVNDTLRLITKRPKATKNDNKKRKKKEEEEADTLPPAIKLLELGALTGSTHDVYLPLLINFGTPLDTLNPAAFHLEQKVDTLWKPLKWDEGPKPRDSVSLMEFRIDYPWQYGENYRLVVDSLAATGIYGLWTGPFTHEFKVKAEEDYSNLYLRVEGLDTIPAFVELLNRSDEAVMRRPVEDSMATFLNVNPGDYYARLVIDNDGNGEFTTGSYDDQRQPEYTFYYPKKITLKKNWDLDQTWNIYESAVDLQKPMAIKKNKPAQDKRKKSQQEEGMLDEEDDYFDVNENPFDPKSKRRRDSTGSMSNFGGGNVPQRSRR